MSMTQKLQIERKSYLKLTNQQSVIYQNDYITKAKVTRLTVCDIICI